jgi:hypothetical protein
MLSLEKLLKSTTGRGLGKIVQRAQNMDEIAHKLRLAVAPDLAEQIHAVNVRDDGELVIVCASSAWAARLRFDSEQLVAVARELGADVTRCRVRIGS